jgi:replicative DNA helicase
MNQEDNSFITKKFTICHDAFGSNLNDDEEENEMPFKIK